MEGGMHTSATVGRSCGRGSGGDGGDGGGNEAVGGANGKGDFAFNIFIAKSILDNRPCREESSTNARNSTNFKYFFPSIFYFSQRHLANRQEARTMASASVRS